MCRLQPWREFAARTEGFSSTALLFAAIRAVFDLFPDLFPLFPPGEGTPAGRAGFDGQIVLFDSVRHRSAPLNFGDAKKSLFPDARRFETALPGTPRMVEFGDEKNRPGK
jgi:hypothetical protein